MSTKKKVEKVTTPMEALLGDTLATNEKGAKTPTATALKDKDLVALYFSAKWCPPCRAFSPILKEFYKACSEKGKLEIVYISSDKSIPEWQEYYGSMPWLSLPEGSGSTSQVKNTLAQKLQIRGIPTLIVLDVKTGKFITAGAREDVTPVGGNVDKGLEVIEAWKKVEPVPIEEANFSPGGGGGLMGILMFILKNPIYIVGLLYFYKRFLKYMTQSDDSIAADDTSADVPLMEEQQDSEF